MFWPSFLQISKIMVLNEVKGSFFKNELSEILSKSKGPPLFAAGEKNYAIK